MLPATPAFPLRLRHDVFWSDMDALGHVNNGAYLRWFEEARIQYFARAKIPLTRGEGVILASQRIDYLAPVLYPDKIELGLSITRLGRSSFTMAFEIRSETQAAAVARGEGVGVCFDYATKRPIALSDAVRASIAAFEASA